MAAQASPANTPAGSTPAGLIMKVTQEFARNMSVVPTAFNKRPMVRCTHFLNPPCNQYQP